MKKIFCISLLLLCFIKDTKSQGCNWSPADCPDEASIKDSQDSLIRLWQWIAAAGNLHAKFDEKFGYPNDGKRCKVAALAND